MNSCHEIFILMLNRPHIKWQQVYLSISM